MALQRLERTDWRAFFDRVAHGLIGRTAEIEVTSLRLGDQLVTSASPVLGISYDPHGDVIAILLDGFEHLVRHPREVYVDVPPLGWVRLGVVDDEGALQIICVRDPLMLPSHAHS